MILRIPSIDPYDLLRSKLYTKTEIHFLGFEVKTCDIRTKSSAIEKKPLVLPFDPDKIRQNRLEWYHETLWVLLLSIIPETSKETMQSQVDKGWKMKQSIHLLEFADVTTSKSCFLAPQFFPSIWWNTPKLSSLKYQRYQKCGQPRVERTSLYSCITRFGW